MSTQQVGPLRELRDAVDRIEKQLGKMSEDIRALGHSQDTLLDRVRVEVSESITKRMSRCPVCVEQAGIGDTA